MNVWTSMIALFLALSLSPPGAPPEAEPSPPAAVVKTASETELVELHALFERSCGQRAYGSFDQVCEALGDQIRAAQRDADRAKRLGAVSGK